MRSKIENIVEVLKNIDNEVYVVGHKNADMDSLCSSLALTYLLKKLGKSAKALVEKKDIDKLKYFNFDENITSIISSSDYTIILVDANRISRLNSCFEEYYKNAKVTINIDHHNGNDTNADYILSVEDISSTCEIIYNLCEEMKIEIDKLMAEFLFVGIISDTDLFYNRTNQKTLSIASSLVSKKIDNKYLIHEFYLKKSHNEMILIVDMIKKIKFDKFHYIILDMNDQLYKTIDYMTISKKCIPIILNDEKIEFLIVILKYNDKIKGEIRSKINKDASILAKRLIGGGHTDAAGFSNNKSIDEIINITKIFLKE